MKTPEKDGIKMVLTKQNRRQVFAAVDGRDFKKGDGSLPIKRRETLNHWAILDEIEAPMWADLTVECYSSFEDNDDEWFHRSHPFHQHSARQLISSSCSAVHPMDLAPTSPELPPSVSKSRGKDYKSRKHDPVACSIILNKQRPFKTLSSKSSFLNTGSEEAVKTYAFDGKLKENLNYKSDSVGKNTLAETAALVFSKSVSSVSDKNTSAKSEDFEREESSSTSTITTEAMDGKHVESSSQSSCPSIGLSNLREKVRRSYITRQASRVEIRSTRPSEENMEQTPESRNIMTISEHPTNIVNEENLHKAPAGQTQNMRCKTDLCNNRESSKKMDHGKHTGGHVTCKVKNFIPSTTAKSSMRAREINHSSRTFQGGKENQYGKMVSRKKSSMMKKADGSLQDPIVVKRKHIRK